MGLVTSQLGFFTSREVMLRDSPLILICQQVIDIPKSQEMLKDWDPNAAIGPDDIAETYWNMHTQTRRGFTNEIDIRPMMEKW